MRAALSCGLLALLTAAATLARARPRSDEPPRTILVHVEGPDAEATRREVLAALPEGVEVVAPSADAAAWRASAPVRGRRTDASARLVRAARAAHTDLAMLVTAGAGRKGTPRAIHVVLVAAGERRVDVTVPRHDSEALAHALAALDPDGGPRAPAPSASAPVATDPAPASAAVRDDPPPTAAVANDASAAPIGSLAPTDLAPAKDAIARTSAATRDAGHATINVSAGIEIGTRDFRYTDRRTAALRDYTLTAAPLVAVGGEAYPFAASGRAFVADLGVAGDYARAFALASAPASSSSGSVGTEWSRFAVGPRLRIRPLGDGGPLLHASLQYGEESFALASSDALGNAALPAVAYRYLRPDVDARFALGRFAAHFGAGYLAVLAGGAVAERFPSASVGGVEAHLGVAFTLARGLELRADADYRRYFYSLHPAPGSALVAGGALDQLAGASAALALLL